MSGIIWGIISKKNIKIDYEEKHKSIYRDMKKAINKYSIDHYSTITIDDISFGCGLQYITKESYKEVLPYYDKTNNLLITADAIIDNREELIELLELGKVNVDKYTDSEYILFSYIKWGKECTKYIIGDYSFAIWDFNKAELFLAKDHVGKRTLYYYENDDYFVFSTINRVLLCFIDKPVLNERWITDYLAIAGIMPITEAKETIIKDIYQVKPFHTLVYDKKSIIETRYWNPIEEIKEISYDTEEEYIKAFMAVYEEAVNCRVRTDKNVGILLSSGLDSTSVAAIAAPCLDKQKKTLYSYTQIPRESYVSTYPNGKITDESNLVSEFIRLYNNISAKFYTCEGENSYDCIDEVLDICETPYKFIENSYWINYLIKKASMDNCKIILGGQYGNSTVSFGDIFVNAKELFSRGKIVSLLREMKYSAKYLKTSSKKMLKVTWSLIKPYKLQKKEFNKLYPEYDRFFYCSINKDLIKRYNVVERFDKLCYNENPRRIPRIKDVKKFIVNESMFSSISTYETMNSLYYGVLLRDPTRDKRIIEYCLSIPYNLYVRNGIDRYLLRKSMEGKIQDSIRMNFTKKGLQAADWRERIAEDLPDKIYLDIKNTIDKNMIKQYIDYDKLLEEINILKNPVNNIDEQFLRMYFIVLTLSRYTDTLNNL